MYIKTKYICKRISMSLARCVLDARKARQVGILKTIIKSGASNYFIHWTEI